MSARMRSRELAKNGERCIATRLVPRRALTRRAELLTSLQQVPGPLLSPACFPSECALAP